MTAYCTKEPKTMNTAKRTTMKAFLNGATTFVSLSTRKDAGCARSPLATRRGIGRHFAKTGMRIRNACTHEGLKPNG